MNQNNDNDNGIEIQIDVENDNEIEIKNENNGDSNGRHSDPDITDADDHDDDDNNNTHHLLAHLEEKQSLLNEQLHRTYAMRFNQLMANYNTITKSMHRTFCRLKKEAVTEMESDTAKLKARVTEMQLKLEERNNECELLRQTVANLKEQLQLQHQQHQPQSSPPFQQYTNEIEVEMETKTEEEEQQQQQTNCDGNGTEERGLKAMLPSLAMEMVENVDLMASDEQNQQQQQPLATISESTTFDPVVREVKFDCDQRSPAAVSAAPALIGSPLGLPALSPEADSNTDRWMLDAESAGKKHQQNRDTIDERKEIAVADNNAIQVMVQMNDNVDANISVPVHRQVIDLCAESSETETDAAADGKREGYQSTHNNTLGVGNDGGLLSSNGGNGNPFTDQIIVSDSDCTQVDPQQIQTPIQISPPQLVHRASSSSSSSDCSRPFPFALKSQQSDFFHRYSRTITPNPLRTANTENVDDITNASDPLHTKTVHAIGGVVGDGNDNNNGDDDDDDDSNPPSFPTPRVLLCVL